MSKLKTLWNANERIAALEEHAEKLSNEVQTLSNAFANTLTAVQDLQESIVSMKEDVQQTAQHVKHTGETFTEELERFRGLKLQLQQEFLARGEQELGKNLKTMGAELSVPHETYLDMKTKLTNLTAHSDNLVDSLKELKGVAETIKQEDFKFNKALHTLKLSERERHDLLRKIESLERLAAGLRKKRGAYQRPSK